MQSGPPRGPKRQSLYMICNNLSFDSCQCCCLTMGSMWWGVSKWSISSLSPFCAEFCAGIGCLLFGLCRISLTPPEIILDPAWFASYLLHLGDLTGRRGRLAALRPHLVSQILHRAAFNLSFCSEPSAVLVVTTFATSFRGVCNRNVVWIFCDCNSGNL